MLQLWSEEWIEKKPGSVGFLRLPFADHRQLRMVPALEERGGPRLTGADRGRGERPGQEAETKPMLAGQLSNKITACHTYPKDVLASLGAGSYSHTK